VREPIVIPNAIDVAAFAIDRPPSDSFRVGFVGRLDPVKRIDVLLAAMKRLPTNFTLDIFGDGVEREKLEALAGPRVVFHGRIDRPQTALSAIDLLVLPSEAEGFGLVLIEAMAAGVPVVASDAPGIRDVVTHERDGLLVPVGDAEALSRAIERIATDATLRGQLIVNGRATARCYDYAATLPLWKAALGLG
jgi:glycosyltransferase involved in cell wall biosynthesis